MYLASSQAVTFNSCNGYVPTSQLLRDSGTITQRMKVNGHSVYLIDNGFVWTKAKD